MLDFFRKYQRIFFAVVAVFVITSFSFFGAFSTFGNEGEKRSDKVAGVAIDGSSFMLSEVQDLARFLATDREDLSDSRGVPNLCNDGVVRHDFIEGGLADLLAANYFESLKTGLELRLEKAKRYSPYVHRFAPAISAKAVWQRTIPEINGELIALQSIENATPALFSRLSKLYLLQGRFPPNVLQRILFYQLKQIPDLAPDPAFAREDLSLFGFHSAADWFGRDFLDLTAQFILNAARFAEQKGYKVSLEEAKGDLIHSFQESMKQLRSSGQAPEVSFQQHLRSLGFDEARATASWQKVLLFRKYFQDVGNCSFQDNLSYKGFDAYARETAVLQTYHFPIRLKTAKDIAEYKLYIEAVAKKIASGLPVEFYTASEVEKKYPELVVESYRANIGEVTKKQVGLIASIKQVRDYSLDETNWPLLQKQFSLGKAVSREERFSLLEKHLQKGEIDAWVRGKLVDLNPSWIEEALAKVTLQEKSWTVSGGIEPILKKEGIYYKIEGLEKTASKSILPFVKARAILAKLSAGKEEPAENPLQQAAKQAVVALTKDPFDPSWVQSGESELTDQFKLSAKIEPIQRNAKGSWMKDEAFAMPSNLWSPIHAAEDGEIVFFYLKEKKTPERSLLEQISFGKAILSSDAKAFAAKQLLNRIVSTTAIRMPLNEED